MPKATWRNGKRAVTGVWEWHWAAQRFHIVLDQRDRITGMNKCLTLGGDTPEWGNWKLVRDSDTHPKDGDVKQAPLVSGAGRQASPNPGGHNA